MLIHLWQKMRATVKRRLALSCVPLLRLMLKSSLLQEQVRCLSGQSNENNDDPATNGEYHLVAKCPLNSGVVFDVGANIGDWCRFVLSCHSNVRVHCFEPSFVTFQQLKNNLPSDVVLNNFGLSSTSASQPLYIYENGGGMNSLYLREGLEVGYGITIPEQSETIKLITLDEYCEIHRIDKIDFLKIDTEGHDLHVLQGALGLLKSGRIIRLQFEYGGANIDSRSLLKDFFEILMPLNYKIFKVMPSSVQELHAYDQRLENFQYKNFFAEKTAIRNK